ncbi:unnamed protein product [marine sediment metagenome]|uniref:Uncharacterized protein n=1 Tax=marine sediment metagenome TaxID=412755 RepID=X0VKV8_9ZZZZ
MSHDSAYIRNIALIRMITLLENAIKKLIAEGNMQAIISDEWIKNYCPTISSQVHIIISTSANDVASKFLVMKLSKLNDYILEGDCYLPYALRLSREALFAYKNAIQANAHIWTHVQIQSILKALESATVVKTKGLPFVEYEKEQQEKKKKKQKRLAL